MEEALISYLLDYAPLTALVVRRVYWVERPQGDTLPAVVMHLIDGLPNYTMGGPSGFVQSRVQVNCWGASYKSAKTVSRVVEDRLSGASATVGAVVFQGIFKDGETDDVEPTPGGTSLKGVRMDFLISHNG